LSSSVVYDNNLYHIVLGAALEQRFARRTILAAIDVMAAHRNFTHAALSALLIDFGQEVAAAVRGDREASLAKRCNDLKTFIDNNPGFEVDGDCIENVLIEKAVEYLPKPINSNFPWSNSLPPEPHVERFHQTLAEDGYSINGGELRRSLPADLKLPEAESELVELLIRHGFETSKGHLDQAFDAQGRRNWASSNAQIRAFFDSLLDDVAERLEPSAKGLASGQPRRAKLAAIGFLSRSLNEWDDDGRGYINGLVKRLHPAGAHPGLSDEDDNTFRMHTVLLTSRLFLRRFDLWGRP
jgi:hypothetical protein